MEVLRDKFRGALLGTLLGDAVGAPWEGTDAEQIAAVCQAYPTLDAAGQKMNCAIFGLLLDDTAAGIAYYTDDTQMTLALADVLVEHGAALQAGQASDFEAVLATRFADVFDPARGYGPGAQSVLLAIRRGADWATSARRLFGGTGSFGNGAAMRVAPLGVFLHTAEAEKLHEAIRRSALPTHTHLLAIGGAVLQATAVATACRLPFAATFDAAAFLDSVEAALHGDELQPYRDSCQRISELLPYRVPPPTVGDVLGCDISALGSVPAALYSFLTHPGDFKAAVTFAVKIGGDTDTIAAMCGAISGAYVGASALPQERLASMENGRQGRDYAADLADRLFARWSELDSPKAV